MAYERWSEGLDKSRTPIKFVQNLQHKLKRVNEFAQDNIAKSKEEMKRKFDIEKVKRQFSPGDKALILFPIACPPFQVKSVGRMRSSTELIMLIIQ